VATDVSTASEHKVEKEKQSGFLDCQAFAFCHFSANTIALDVFTALALQNQFASPTP
jgi:hypothetical protein